MKALIDGDIVVFKAGFAAEKRKYVLVTPAKIFFDRKKDLMKYVKDEDIDTYEFYTERKVEPASHAVHNAKNLLTTILSATSPDDFTVYLSGENNFRKALSPSYKANRNETHRPEHEAYIKNYILESFRGELVNGQEADDALGINQAEDTIICTLDKDLDMIPGWHYNWDRDERYFVNEHTALTNFYCQLLSGDSTDNIVGVPKIGKKTAAKLIAPLPTYKAMEEEIGEQYKKVYGDRWREEMVVNGRLLWIRRKPEELWEPEYV